MKLPDEFAQTLIDADPIEQYRLVHSLRVNGWTLQSIADALGVSREWARVLNVRAEGQMSTTPVPLPKKIMTHEVLHNYSPITLTPETISTLRAMHDEVRGLNGGAKKSDPRRKVAKALAEILNQLMRKGVTGAQLARAMGVTTGAVYMRLARYGYRTPYPSMKHKSIKGHASYEEGY